MPEPKNARIGYGRVSTRDQNPDSQRDALEAAGCDRIFIDRGVSGKLAKRPQLDAALDYLREGDTLVITRLSRASRSLRHLMDLFHTLDERGIGLDVLKQGIDTTSAAGRLAFHIMGAIDEFQRELIVEGTHEGLAAARARGRKGGRKPKLDERQAARARAMYEEVGPDGKRAWTVEQVAKTFNVTRPTIYRHLASDTATAEAKRGPMTRTAGTTARSSSPGGHRHRHQANPPGHVPRGTFCSAPWVVGCS